MAISSSFRRYLKPGALEWTDKAYVLDWVIVITVWLLSWLVTSLPVFERDFSPRDPIIGHPHKSSQISSLLNQSVAFYAPILATIIYGIIQKSLVEVHHSILSLCASRGFAHLITEVMKHEVGRLRPDFLARCKWDDVAEKCTGKKSSILDGRKSFPSGHSSTAFVGMVFLSLWLAGKTAAWCFSAPRPSGNLVKSSRMASFTLTILPLSWATFVAVSRIQDYKHHKEDVIVGSLIGIVCASVCYFIYWPSPFSERNFKQSGFGRPRELYGPNELYSTRNDGFQLTRMEDDETDVV